MLRPALVLALATLVVAAGCGGGSSSNERLSKAEFIKKADAVCAKYDERFDDIEFPDVDPTLEGTTDDDVRSLADPLSKAADVRRDAIDELDDLRPPEAFQKRYDTVLADLQSLVDELEAAVAAARDANRQALLTAFARANDLSEKANGIARTYGLEVCGRG